MDCSIRAVSEMHVEKRNTLRQLKTVPEVLVRNHMLKLVMDCAIGAVSEAHVEERNTLKQLRTVRTIWTVQ